MQDTPKKNIAELFDDHQGMDRALARAVRKAVLHHKRTGNPARRWGQVLKYQHEMLHSSGPEARFMHPNVHLTHSTLWSAL